MHVQFNDSFVQKHVQCLTLSIEPMTLLMFSIDFDKERVTRCADDVYILERHLLIMAIETEWINHDFSNK